MTNEVKPKDLSDQCLSEFQLFSNMLSKTVHDINNPLAVLIGQLSIVEILKEQDKLSPEKLDKVLSKLESSSRTFKERLDQLRNFYKIPLNDEAFQEVDKVVNSVCYYLDKLAFTNDIHLNQNIERGIKTNLDADKLFIVLRNLILNSIESIILNSKAGGTIEITSEVIEDKVRIKVADTGPGLVCEPNLAFELGYTTKDHKHKGYGLSVAKDILDKQNIEIQYQKSEKTEFFLDIPKK